MRQFIVLLLLLPSVQGCSLIMENFNEADWADGILTAFRGQAVVFDPDTATMTERPYVIFEHVKVGEHILRTGQDGLGADCSGTRYVELLQYDLAPIEKWVNASGPIAVGDAYAFMAGRDAVVVNHAGSEVQRTTLPDDYLFERLEMALLGTDVLLLNENGDFLWLDDGVAARLNGSTYGALQQQVPGLAVNPNGDIAILQAGEDANRLWILADDQLQRVIELPGMDGWSVEMSWFEGWLIQSHGAMLHVADDIVLMPRGEIQTSTFPGLPTTSDPGRLGSVTAAPDGSQAAVFITRESGEDEVYLFGPGMVEEGMWKYTLPPLAEYSSQEGTWEYASLAAGDAVATVTAQWTTLEGEPIFRPNQDNDAAGWSPLFVLGLLLVTWTTRQSPRTLY